MKIILNFALLKFVLSSKVENSENSIESCHGVGLSRGSLTSDSENQNSCASLERSNDALKTSFGFNIVPIVTKKIDTKETSLNSLSFNDDFVCLSPFDNKPFVPFENLKTPVKTKQQPESLKTTEFKKETKCILEWGNHLGVFSDDETEKEQEQEEEKEKKQEETDKKRKIKPKKHFSEELLCLRYFKNPKTNKTLSNVVSDNTNCIPKKQDGFFVKKSEPKTTKNTICSSSVYLKRPNTPEMDKLPKHEQRSITNRRHRYDKKY